MDELLYSHFRLILGPSCKKLYPSLIRRGPNLKLVRDQLAEDLHRALHLVVQGTVTLQVTRAFKLWAMAQSYTVLLTAEQFVKEYKIKDLLPLVESAKAKRKQEMSNEHNHSRGG